MSRCSMAFTIICAQYLEGSKVVLTVAKTGVCVEGPDNAGSFQV